MDAVNRRGVGGRTACSDLGASQLYRPPVRPCL